MLPYNIDHVAIAVYDLDATLADLKRQYGAVPLSREVVEAQGVEEAMVPIGGSNIQILQPLSPDSPVGRFLEKRGEGMHHIAFTVPNIELALDHLLQAGTRLIDKEPRRGGGGHLVAFVHPSAFAGTLVELVEGAT